MDRPLAEEAAPLGEKWGYSGKAYGWSLRLLQKQKTLVYLIPCRGHFVASFALGDKACQAAAKSGLPAALLERIASAPKYPEGRGVRIGVRTKSDVREVLQIAAFKMAV